MERTNTVAEGHDAYPGRTGSSAASGYGVRTEGTEYTSDRREAF